MPDVEESVYSGVSTAQEAARLVGDQHDQLTRIIHGLTDPSLPYDIERIKLTALLGQAAYYLAAAKEVALAMPVTAQPSSEVEPAPEVLTESEVPAEPAVEPLEEVTVSQPTQEPETTKPSERTVAKGSKKKIEAAPKIERVVGTDEPAAEQEKLQEHPTPSPVRVDEQAEKPSRIPRLLNFAISNTELTTVEKVVTYLQDFEERKSLKDITSAVLGKARVPKATETRLIEVLDAYSEAGVLRKYGKTYGYVTEAEQAAIDAADKFIVIETNPELEEGEIKLIKFVEKITEGGQHEVNVGQIVRGYFGVQRLDSDTFKDAITYLNLYAEQGYLVHAPGSPWYGLGYRRIEQGTVPSPAAASIESSPESVAFTTDDEVATPDTEVQPADEQMIAVLEKAGAKLNELEQAWLKFMLSAVEPGDEFTRTTFNFKSAGVVEPTGSQFSNLANKLLKSSLAVDNGKQRGGRKLRFGEALQALQPAPIENSVSDQTTKPLSKKKRQPAAKKAAAIEQQSPAPALPATDDEMIPYSLPDLTSEERAAEFSLMLVRGITNAIILSKSDMVRDTMISHQLAASFDVPVKTANGWLKELIAKNHFHLEREEGSSTRYLVPGPKDEPIVASQARNRTPEVEEAILPATQENLIAFISQHPHKSVGTVTKLLAQSFGIEVAESKSRIAELLAGNHLVYGKRGRDRTLRVVNGPGLEAQPGQEPEKKKIDVKQWRESDIDKAFKVFRELGRFKHVQQGIVQPKLIARFGITPESKEDKEFRRALQRMKAYGYILIEDGNPNTRSDHSKKLYLPIVKFANQKIKDRYRKNPAGLRAEMLALLDA